MANGNPEKGKLRFIKWGRRTYTESSVQVGPDHQLLSGQSIERTVPSSSDSDTIYVENSNTSASDSNTGTSTSPCLTLEGALAKVTSSKHKIIIKDNGTYAPPSRITNQNLSGIYAAASKTPLIQDSTAKIALLKDHSTNTIVKNKLCAYNHNLYYFLQITGTTFKVYRYNPFSNTSTEIATAASGNLSTTKVTISGSTLIRSYSSSTTTILIEQCHLVTGAVTAYDLTSSTDRRNLIHDEAFDNEALTCAFNNTSTGKTLIYKADTVGSSYSSLFDFDTPSNYLLSGYEKQGEYYYFSFTHTTDQTIKLVIRRWNGVVSEEIISADYSAALYSGQFVVERSSASLFFIGDTDTYSLNNGSVVKVLAKAMISVCKTKKGYIGTFFTRVRETLDLNYQVMRVNSFSLDLLEAGALIESGSYSFSESIKIPRLCSYLGNIYYGKGSTINEIQNTIIDFGRYMGQNPLSTVLLIKSDTTDGSTTFVDSSVNAHTVTVNGDVQHDTADAKVGGSSILFDGTGDYLSIPDHAAFDFGTDNFAIGLWYKFGASANHTAGYTTLFDLGYSGTSGGTSRISFHMTGTNSARLRIGGTNYSISYTGTLSVWTFLYIARVGNLIYVHRGTENDTTTTLVTTIDTSSTVSISSSDPVNIGRTTSTDFTGPWVMNGWIDEFFVFQGTLPYSSSTFVIPEMTPPYGGEDYGIGSVTLSGLDLQGIYMENLVYSRNKNQKLIIEYCRLKHSCHAILNMKTKVNKSIIQDSSYVVKGDSSEFIDETQYSGGTYTNSIYKNIHEGFTYYITNKGTSGLFFSNNTFLNFGKMDIDITRGLSFLLNVFAGAIADDFGTIHVDGSVTKDENLSEAGIFYEKGGVVAPLEEYQEKVLFRDVTEDLRLRSWQMGHTFYNTPVDISVITYHGAYQSTYSSTSSAPAYVDIPVPKRMAYTKRFSKASEMTSINSKYYREAKVPVLEIDLYWDEDSFVKKEDMVNFMALQASDSFWECLLTDIAYIEYDNSSDYIDINLGPTPSPMMEGRLVLKVGNILAQVTEAKGNRLYTHNPNSINAFRYLVDPIASANHLRGFPVYIAPQEVTAQASVFKGNFQLETIQQLKGLSLKLIVDLNFDGLVER